MTRLLLASHNQNKIKEISILLPAGIQIISLTDVGFTEEIEEPFESLEENAAEKCRVLYERFALPCIADDSGLFVDALRGAPGVKSARYAGEPANDKNNIRKLIAAMDGAQDRRATFKTALCLRTNNETKFFLGECKGNIIMTEKGNSGFGYDPVFVAEGETKTFAEMNMEEKNKFSHRKKAVYALLAYLNQEYAKD